MEKFAVDPAWHDKDSKVPKFRELYEQNDFLTAYSKHTDLRMRADPKWAIGRGDEWESHGLLQLDFLKRQGLLPEHRLLDVGCGPGRAARRFVPYLMPHRYVGCDISRECLKHAENLSMDEGWDSKGPIFIENGDLDLLTIESDRFDFIWAHSVFTHLPEEQIYKMVGNAAKILSDCGKMLFTYKRAAVPMRTGLKQFAYPIQFFEVAAKRHGLVATSLDFVWPASQRTGLITRAA
jgi:SAM-dependent methyltransferase